METLSKEKLLVVLFEFGTTIIIVVNDIGTYICYDSKATRTLSPEEQKEYEESGEKAPSHGKAVKAIPIGDHLYVTIAGNNYWSFPITDFLKNEVKTRAENCTPQRCAQKALEVYKDTTYVHSSETQKDINIQNLPSSMSFSSYNESGVDLKTTYVRRNEKGKTSWANVIKKSEEKSYVKSVDEEEPLITFCCHGSGARYANPILSSRIEFIESGTDIEAHVEEILKAMAWSCKKDSTHTGETINLILLTADGVRHLYKEKKAVDLMKSYGEWLKEQKFKDLETRLARSRSKKEQMKSDGEG